MFLHVQKTITELSLEDYRGFIEDLAVKHRA
jgi:hypothetical protein